MLLSKDYTAAGGGSTDGHLAASNEAGDFGENSDSLVANAGTDGVVDSIPVHPLGIKPLGNLYFASGPQARQSLAGPVALLPDEMILHLLDYLDSASLRTLGNTCRFLYAFSRLDDLWKALFLERESARKIASQPWTGSWRATYLGIPNGQQAKIDCSNVFSDVLHRPFTCSHIRLQNHTSQIPDTNLISRLPNLTYQDFAENWSQKPFILTDCIRDWPVCREWTIPSLLRKYPDVEFRAEAVDWTFSRYCQYMFNSEDESPLYLFDRKFAEKMSINVGHDNDASYWPPECFGPDLFGVLGSERPAHRWLIIGPERSGSTFHKDPNGTSAWNAVLEGSKYWIMFPPAAQVPGVFVSEDSSEVTSPLSIAEWLLEFHAEARKQPGCLEGICKAGEILHVPSGWWHLVVNLEPGIALTQNFVPKSHLADVLLFLRDKADQVSGFECDLESPYALFVDRLKEQYPELLDGALEEMESKAQRKKRKWEDAVGTKTEDKEGGGGFSFGFGGDSDEEVP